MSMAEVEQLPGFRFHPTEDELINFYLKRIINDNKLDSNVIGFLNIYLHDPWELPGLARIGEREWYFFVPRNRKHGPKGKTNRTTRNGFWKATGSDRQVRSSIDPKKVIGLKKTLVFYNGRAPKGSRTDWVMNEYTLPDGHPKDHDIVLCKVYRKATSFKVLEQRAIVEEHTTKIPSKTSSPQSQDSLSPLVQQEDLKSSVSQNDSISFKILEEENRNTIVNSTQLWSSNAFVEPLASPLWTEPQSSGQDLWSLYSLFS